MALRSRPRRLLSVTSLRIDKPRWRCHEAPRAGGEPLCKMAALSVASRRLPGIAQRNVLPIASILCGMGVEAIELPRLEPCPGAACCQPIELPSYKAAPLQTPDGSAIPLRESINYVPLRLRAFRGRRRRRVRRRADEAPGITLGPERTEKRSTAGSMN